MAKGLWLCLMVVLAVASSTAALRCYHCTDCDDDEDGSAKDCSASYDTCLKISIAGRVHKSCSQKAACGLGAVERGVVSAWNKLKNLLSDVDQDFVDIPDDAEANSVLCCDGDLCNAASSKIANPVLLLLVPLVAYLLRC